MLIWGFDFLELSKDLIDRYFGLACAGSLAFALTLNVLVKRIIIPGDVCFKCSCTQDISAACARRLLTYQDAWLQAALTGLQSGGGVSSLGTASLSPSQPLAFA